MRALKIDSILSIGNRVKGQEQWLKRQINTPRPPSKETITSYFDEYRPDVILFLETPFTHDLYALARDRGIKTVGVPMHEIAGSCAMQPDMVICTCYSAWEKVQHPNKRLLFLPISTELFPYRARRGHTFFCNVGYGGPGDRRQTEKIIEAFTGLKSPNARLLLTAQKALPKETRSNDRRITYRVRNYADPGDGYRNGDIALATIAYGGYERTILEAMASGMPTLVTNADPMNLYQHDPDFLIHADRTWELNDKWVERTLYHEVSVETLREKMEWLLTIDTEKYSRWARAQAEAQSWESKDIDYLGKWKHAIESL